MNSTKSTMMLPVTICLPYTKCQSRAIFYPLIYLTCDSNVKCWSTITLKNFVWLVLLMTTSSITKLLLRAIWPLRLRKIMKYVFLRFNESLLVFSQSTTFIISSFVIFTRSSGFLPDTNISESSAKKSENRTLDTLARSFMFNKKSNGPNMETWGTPYVIKWRVELQSLYTTYCSLS